MATLVLANDSFIFALFKRIVCFVLFRLVVMLLAGRHQCFTRVIAICENFEKIVIQVKMYP